MSHKTISKEAYGKENVVPVNFLRDNPFYDIGSILTKIEKDINDGEIEDIIIVCRAKDSLRYIWRGESRGTTFLGMLEWAKGQILNYFD